MARFHWMIAIFLISALSACADGSPELRTAVAAEWQTDWAAAAVVLTFLSLCLSGGALYALFRSLKQTDMVMEETRDLGQRQTRAYVEAADLEFSSQEGDVVVICKNSGETPSPFFAIGVTALKVRGNDMYDALSKRSATIPTKSWAGLGKGAEWRAKVTPSYGSQEVQEFSQRRFNDDERLLITGAVVYKDIFGRYFRTEFAFFTHNEVNNGFLRPYGEFASYVELPEAEIALQLGPTFVRKGVA